MRSNNLIDTLMAFLAYSVLSFAVLGVIALWVLFGTLAYQLIRGLL